MELGAFDVPHSSETPLFFSPYNYYGGTENELKQDVMVSFYIFTLFFFVVYSLFFVSSSICIC